MTIIAEVLFAFSLVLVAWSLHLLNQVERLCNECKERLEADIRKRKEREVAEDLSEWKKEHNTNQRTVASHPGISDKNCEKKEHNTP